MATGIEAIRLMSISVEICSEKFRFAAAAKGPGVGGTSTWVVYNPDDNANESWAELAELCAAMLEINRERIMNPESQKTGMPTMIPMVVMASTE